MVREPTHGLRELNSVGMEVQTPAGLVSFLFHFFLSILRLFDGKFFCHRSQIYNKIELDRFVPLF
jgi:hypothetical protein